MTAIIEIAKETVETNNGLSVREAQIVCKAFIVLSEEMEDHKRIAELAKADAERNREAIDSAARLIREYINDGASDGRAMECGVWLCKYGEKK